MPTKIEIPWEEVQSDAWWERAAAGDLSPIESCIWQTYLDLCPACRREWETLAIVDHILREAPPPPPVSTNFTQTTLQRLQQTHSHAVLSRWIGLTLLAFVLVLEIVWLGHEVLTAHHLLEILLAGKQVWGEALTLTWNNFFISWQRIVPFALTLALLAFLWSIPNGMMVTASVWFWTRRHTKNKIT